MMDPVNPSVIALHGALVELTLRLNRVEEALRLHQRPVALATFAQEGSNIPPPYEPCSCEESTALRQHIVDLAAKLGVVR